MNNNNFFQTTPKKDDNQSAFGNTGMSQSSLFGAPTIGQPQQGGQISPFQSSQTTSLFGQKPTGMFGSQPAPPSLNTFGSTSFSPFTGASSSFGSTPSFGTTGAPSSFGSTPAQSSFGMNSSQFSGASSQPAFDGSALSFGNKPAISSFGSSTAQSPFGNASFNSTQFGGTPQMTSSFGSSQVPSPYGTSQALTTSSPYGTSQAPTTSSSFSSSGQFGGTSQVPSMTSSFTPSNSFGASSSSFGQKGNITPVSSFSGNFNASNTFGQPSAGSSWSATPTSGWGMTNKGSKTASYTTTRVTEEGGFAGDITDITAMKEYSGKPVDELRQEDYAMSLCPPRPSASGPFISTGNLSFGNSQSTTPSFGGFSSTPSQFSAPTTSLFGQAALKPATPTNLFGGSLPTQTPTNYSSFNTQANGSYTPAMKAEGVQTIATPSNPFASSTFGSNNQPSLFGNTSQSNILTSQSPFTANNPSQPTALGSQVQPNIFSSIQQPNGQNTTMGSMNYQPQSTMAPTSTVPSFNFNTNPFASSTAGQANPFATTSNGSFGNVSTQANYRVDTSDPYLLKNIKFDKFVQQKPTIKIPLPSPIFKNKTESPSIDLKIRPPRPISKNSIYTIPDLRDIRDSQTVSNLVVGYEGKGRIEFLEPVTVTSLEDIEKRIFFRNESVEVNDPIGSGLNRKAKVYVEGLFPICRTTNEVIKGKSEHFPQKGIQERFIYQLKNDPVKKFIDYNVDTGIYVYEVNHF